MSCRFGIAFLGRLYGVFALRTGGRVFICVVIRPGDLTARPLLCDALDPVPDLSAAVGRDAAFDDTFVVVNEEPGRRELRQALFLLVEFNRAGDRICRATAQLSLIVYRRAVGPQ